MFLSGLVSWIHWWPNFMSSWVILQTTKALILKTFPMVRIPTVSSSKAKYNKWGQCINKISKCFLNFLAFLICNKAENDASCNLSLYVFLILQVKWLPVTQTSLMRKWMRYVYRVCFLLLSLEFTIHCVLSGCFGTSLQSKVIFCSHVHFEVQLELN